MQLLMEPTLSKCPEENTGTQDRDEETKGKTNSIPKNSPFIHFAYWYGRI